MILGSTRVLQATSLERLWVLNSVAMRTMQCNAMRGNACTCIMLNWVHRIKFITFVNQSIKLLNNSCWLTMFFSNLDILDFLENCAHDATLDLQESTAYLQVSRAPESHLLILPITLPFIVLISRHALKTSTVWYLQYMSCERFLLSNYVWLNVTSHLSHIEMFKEVPIY